VMEARGRVAGGGALARLIAGAVPGNDQTVVQIDDARLARVARAAQPAPDEAAAPARSAARSRAGRLAWLAAAGVVVAAVAPAVAVGSHHRVPAAAPVLQAPTTFLVEGRVAVTVPANWPT